MLDIAKKLLREESGQGMVEYGLILALIAVVAMAALGPIGTKLGEIFGAVESKLNDAIPES
ncbi:MAG TPA: Flp family type IVb pilin [Clostridia bacterium]|nr:Flp family type IVb pilin [Clostridia bacterium]